MTSDLARVETAARDLLCRVDPTTVDDETFLGAVYDAGLTWVHFPVGLGGLAASRETQEVADAMLRDAGGTTGYLRNPIGYGMGAPTVASHASPDLAARLLRPLATCEDVWCQLFSEPSAGSDLAGLATSAVRDGDEWVVNGQKVWTSYAHRARWAMLLARTDPTVPKHAGLTYFVLDMHSPGVEVRPLRQMTGESEFNEVYLTDVRVPDSQRLGEIGAGWTVAMTTLMNERVSIGDGESIGGVGNIGVALDLWARGDHRRTALMRDRLARLWIDAQAHRLTAVRRRKSARQGAGPEGSAAKLFGAELNQRVFEAAMDLLGPEAAVYDSYEQSPEQGGFAHAVQRQFLRSRANTIEGGTSDVLRNVIAERMLGLPKEPRPDEGIPWKDIPRG